MDDDLERLENLKKSLDEAEKKKFRLQGNLDSKMDDLAELGLDSIAAAKRKLKKLNTEKERKMKTLEKLISDFKEKYPNLLD